MEGQWERRRILIWGKTRPELSKTYRETVCTGGVFEDTKRLVRLYPIPLRYIDDEQVFKKYQWIEADVKRSASDPRPESYKIRADTIEVFQTIPPKKGDWSERAVWVMHDHNIFPSVEALVHQQSLDHTSLGLVKPAEVSNVVAERFSAAEQQHFQQRYETHRRQLMLPLENDGAREVQPLRPPDFRFKIQFGCSDPRCSGAHQFSVLDWETDALYFNMRSDGDTPDAAAKKVVDKLRNQVCAPDKDLYFYLGNISTHLHVFTIVGLWWPKRKTTPVQPRLF